MHNTLAPLFAYYLNAHFNETFKPGITTLNAFKNTDYTKLKLLNNDWSKKETKGTF